MGSESVAKDRRLYRRLSARDELALEELYDQFGATVFGVALQVTTDREAAEEVTRSVFVDLWRRPDWWDPDLGALRPWLATVARHRAISWVRGEHATRYRAVDVDLRIPERFVTTADPLLTADGVRRALARLPDSERTPILLAYFGGRTYREVAADLDVDGSVVIRQIRAGLRRMDAALRAEPDERVKSREGLRSDSASHPGRGGTRPSTQG